MYKNYKYTIKEFYRSNSNNYTIGESDTESEAINIIKERANSLDLDFSRFTRKRCNSGKIAGRIYYFNPSFKGLCFLIEIREVKK